MFKVIARIAILATISDAIRVNKEYELNGCAHRDRETGDCIEDNEESFVQVNKGTVIREWGSIVNEPTKKSGKGVSFVQVAGKPSKTSTKPSTKPTPNKGTQRNPRGDHCEGGDECAGFVQVEGGMAIQVKRAGEGRRGKANSR